MLPAVGTSMSVHEGINGRFQAGGDGDFQSHKEAAQNGRSRADPRMYPSD
jgi:hypothetical protein